MLYSILLEIRPKHWIKNILVFTPLFFSGNLLNIHFYPMLLLGFIAFSIIASSIYVINDLCDIEQDKLHNKKKYRPIASGKISKSLAYLIITFLVLVGFGIGFFINFNFLLLLVAYFVANLAYSLKIKHIVIYDIIFISMMYFMRVLGGAILINVESSSYIFITVFFGSMFLITAKRYAELISENKEKRKVLEFYNEKVLSSIFLLSMISSLISYVMYTISKGGIYFYSIIFAVYIYMKYVYLVFGEKKGEEPEVILLKDIGIIISTLGWIGFSLYSYYL